MSLSMKKGTKGLPTTFFDRQILLRNPLVDGESECILPKKGFRGYVVGVKSQGKNFLTKVIPYRFLHKISIHVEFP